MDEARGSVPLLVWQCKQCSEPCGATACELWSAKASNGNDFSAVP